MNELQTMGGVLEEIGSAGIIPILTIHSAGEAVPISSALCDGGMSCAEVTLRTDAAEESIKRITAAFPRMLLGAGTVLSIDQVKTAVGSGARFILTPGLNRNVIEYCLKNAIPIIPGVATPSEINTALDAGISIVKLFPAEALGGIRYLQAVGAPFKTIKFVPAGGLNESNVASYLSLPNVHACAGSWMVPPDVVARKDYQAIQRLAQQAVQLKKGK